MTKNDGDIGYKLCLCSVCGQIERCTPNFDYYTTTEHDGLVCEECFAKHCFNIMQN